MVDELNKRLKKCAKEKDKSECDSILKDMVDYILRNRWGFVLEIIEPPYTDNKKFVEKKLIIAKRDAGDGLLQLLCVDIGDQSINDDGLSKITFSEKIQFIKRTINQIPR